MEVKPYTIAYKSVWNKFLETAKNGTFLFHRDFMEYHKGRFQDASLMVFEGDKPIALFPANIQEDCVYSHQGLTYGGLVIGLNTKFQTTYRAYKALLLYLHTKGITKAYIKLIPTFYNTLPADELSYLLYKSGATLQKRDILMVIDYRNYKGFQKNRREGINKARRHGLEVKIDTNFEAFWNTILIPNLAKKHQVKPVHSLEEITALAKRFPEHIKQVNVYQDGKIVAGTTVFLTKTTVHPQYVSGNTNKNTLGSLDLLYDYIIHAFKAQRWYFDFNISSEANGTILNQGLLFWKETCGARAFTADNYLVQTASYKELNLTFK